MNNKKKIIFIVGATASGKSSLSVKMAKENKGEIISADSRQIYKNIPIFSGISDKEKNNFLVGFLEENQKFSAGDFIKLANQKMEKIWKKGKIPIIVGGTSFYLESLIYQNFLPQVGINKKLRQELNGKNSQELMEILKNLDKKRAENIDKKNIPRIIRSIEVAKKLGKVPENKKEIKKNLEIDFFWINLDIEKQKKNIQKNFQQRIKKGLLKEAKDLREKFEKNLSEKEIEKKFYDLGLAYKHIFKFWRGEIDKKKFIELAVLEEQKYAKRQNTYLKKFYKELVKNKINKKIIIK